MRSFVRAAELLSRLFGALAAAMVGLLIALMTYEVVVRYVFGAPTVWGYELTTWVMGASFLLAIAYALATRSHVRVDFVRDLFGAKAIHAVDLAGYVLFLLPLLLWLTVGLWDYFLGAYLTGERTGQSAWNPEVWPFRLVMLLGVAAWTLQVVAEIVKAGLALAGRDTGSRPRA
ncbi:MAG: TRAP transporter small permease subunit [Alphaproteobacteria bacterium]|nr:TRAP transporter small permease subunit [Alphaproteobacteria bacterium]